MKKKKYLLAVVCAVVLMLIFTFAASAAENTYKSGVFTYTVTDGEVTVTGCGDSVEGHLVIPGSIDGYPVTAIANSAFSNCFKLTEITIPTSIKRIGSNAFAGYFKSVHVDSLDFWFNIDFGDNPLYMAENFYVDGKLLTDLVIPEGVTVLPDGIFNGYQSLKSVTLPKSLQVLGEFCFSACDNLESIYADSVEDWINLFSNGVAAGKNMFFYSPLKSKTKLYVGGELLVDLVIPESVTTIPEQTFSGLSSLESITFHKNFISFGQEAFFYCNNLKEIYVPDIETWFKICYDVKWGIYSGAENIETIYINNEPVEDLVIPEHIDTIADYAFAFYKKLRSITFTKPIKQFGDNWCTGCDSFEAIYVDSFEIWNGCDFKNASHNPIRDVDYLYIDGKPVVDLVIPEGTKSISDYAFYGYKALKSVHFPQSLRKIGEKAFSNTLESVYAESLEGWLELCTAMADDHSEWQPMCYAENLYIDGELLVDFAIPETVTYIPRWTFYGVDSLKSLTLSSNIQRIGTDAFLACNNIENVYAPDIDTWFRLPEFKGSLKLKNLYIAGELLTDYVFPEGITEIPDSAFENCIGLESITLPSTLESIGDNAFSGCINLKSITFPSTIKSIGKDAFAGCTNIESVYVPTLECWLGIDFASIESNPVIGITKLYINGELLEVLRVPEGVSEIKQYAFHRYPGIKRFEISGDPLAIAYQAFHKVCNNMEIHAETVEDWLNVKCADIAYNGNPLRYGATLYIGGKQPEEIVIPESIKQISGYAFQNCKTLKKVTIPATTSIGWSAFNGSGLQEAVIGSLTEEIEPVAVISVGFEGCSKLEKITFGYGVKKIGYQAFYEFSNLKEVVFYSGIEEIGERAFDKTAITSVAIPSTVKLIDVRAFANCKSLVDLTLGDTVGYKGAMDIDNFAFSCCTKLEKITINTAGGKIGEKVFEKAQSLKDLYINDLNSYLSIDFVAGQGVYQSNPVYYVENMYINGKIPIDIVIPEGVTRICDSAFYSCDTLETVKFPSTLVEIEDNAFMTCKNLENFTLPESVKRIGEGAFMSCQSLTTVELKSNIKEVGMDAFGCCKNIRTVYLYPKLLNMSEGAFYDCGNIEIILYSGTKDDWNKLIVQNKNSGLENVAVYYGYRPESMKPTEKITASDITIDSITLTWTKVNGVTGYRVYVRKDNNWNTLETLNANTYKVTGLNRGTKYTFAVKAYISQGAFILWSPEYTTINTATKSACDHKLTTLKAVAPTCTRTGLTEGKKCSVCKTVTVAQKAVAKKAHNYKNITTKATLTSNGKTETVCAACGYTSKIAVVYYPKTIKLSKTSYTYNGKVQTPTVTVKDSKGNTLKKDTDYTVKYESGRKATGTYNVKITFKGKYSGTKTLKYTIAPKATSKITVAQSTKAIKLTWSKVTGATGYRVFQYNAKTKTWDKIKTLTGTSYKVQNLKAGTTYKFRIKAYKSDESTIWGAATTITVATKPATSKITKLTTAKAKATLVWSDVAGENGYEVYASTKKDSGFKKVATTKANTVKVTVSKLTSGKTYYFKVRAYKTVDGKKIYGAWSTVKNVKVK